MTPDERRTYRRWLLAAAATAAALRARFLATSLSVDEAGALTAARSWAAGRGLYTDVFIDRPQGVVALFQRWDEIAGAHPSSVRLLAIAAGVAAVGGAATTARAVSGSWRAGAATAWLVAVISSSAAFEGYAVNGELLAGAFTVPAMAIGALVVTRRAAAPWMLAAGGLAAGGMSMKQSGFDVLAALAAWLVVAAICRWLPRREAAGLLALLLVGAGAVAALVVGHGASLGWDDYRYAVLGFRSHARSAVTDPRLAQLAVTALVALPLLGPTAVLVVRRLREHPGPLWARARPPHALLALWLVAAGGAFVVGGNFHRHYWIGLTVPFATAAGVCLASGAPTWSSLRRTLALALALPLAISLVLIAAPGIERDRRVDADAALARWVEEHQASPDQELLPLCASATYYIDARQIPAYRYLWVDHVRHGRGATADLVELLDGPRRPTFVALHQPLSTCDPSGRVRAVIDRRYHRVATVADVPVLRAR